MSLLDTLLGRRGKAPARSGEDLLITILIVLVGVLLVVTFVYWATGQVAGRLFGGAWPEVTFASMPGVLSRALSDPGDPAAAWPAAAQALLPGPVGFYAVMAALCLLPAGAAVTALYLVLSGTRAKKAAAPARRRHRRRAFASRRALRPLTVSQPKPGRVTLGRAAGRLLAAEAGQSVVVLGPPRSLKTAGLALPAVLEWQGPVVVTCTSSRLVLDSLERRQELGMVRVFDPAGTLGDQVPRVGWSPLRHAGTWSGAQRAARSLTAATPELVAAPHGPPTAPETPAQAPPGAPTAAVTDLLAAALLGAESTGRAATDALGWLERGERDELERALDTAGVRVGSVTFGELWELGEPLRERVYARAAQVLAPWADAEARTGAAEQLDPAWLLDGGNHTLYLTAPADELPQLRPLLATVLQEVVAAAQERAGRGPRSSGPSGGPPLLLVLDDAADVGALRTLDVHAAAASHGIQVLSMFRSLADVRARYGERAHAVLNGHRARVVLSGTTDPETLDYVANLLGDPGIRARGPEKAERRITPAGVLRDLQPGVGLLLYGSLPPAELSLRPWFKDKSVRALVGARRLAAYGHARPRGPRPARREAAR